MQPSPCRHHPSWWWPTACGSVLADGNLPMSLQETAKPAPRPWPGHGRRKHEPPVDPDTDCAWPRSDGLGRVCLVAEKRPVRRPRWSGRKNIAGRLLGSDAPSKASIAGGFVTISLPNCLTPSHIAACRISRYPTSELSAREEGLAATCLHQMGAIRPRSLPCTLVREPSPFRCVKRHLHPHVWKPQ